jgi:hypothetical protein
MPDAEVPATEMVLREECRPCRSSRSLSYSLPGRFRSRRRVRWAGIFPGNDASVLPPQNKGSFPFDITKHSLTHIKGDLPSKGVH